MFAAIVFWVAAVVSVLSAAAVFWVMSMARATYALAISFVAVGVALIVMGLHYIGIVMILMMVMEMAIMAIFMVMFMGHNPALMAMHMTQHKRSASIVAVTVFVGLAAGIVLVRWPGRPGGAAPALTAELGEALMGSKMLVMLTISPVLLATIVAAMVLAGPRGRYERYGDDLDRDVPVDPERGGIGR